MPVIVRHEGQENVIDAKAAAVPPWDQPGDEGLPHLENLAALSNTFSEAVGDPERHIAVHVRFLRTPLGQAMPKRLRSKLIDHVFGHLAVALELPAESGVPKRPMQEAYALATLERDYANGVTG